MAELASRKNPRVFFDVTIDDVQQDRMEMDLYKDEVPLAAANFRVLCANAAAAANPPSSLSFKCSIFPYIIPGFIIILGGDFHRTSNGTGTGTGAAGEGPATSCIYGDEFPDVEASGRRNRALDLIITAHAVPKIPRNHAGAYPYSCGGGSSSRFFICVRPCMPPV